MTELAADTLRPYVRYIDKTRAYYLSQGYEKPYVWAHNDERTVRAARQAASASTIALSRPARSPSRAIRASTTIRRPGRRAMSMPCRRTPRHRSCTVGRRATTAMRRRSTIPTPISRSTACTRRRHAGRIGKVASDCLGVYNAYSQRKTTERDAPEVLAAMPRHGRRRRAARPGLTSLPPDRESGRPSPGNEWHSDRGDRHGPRHRRIRRRAATAVRRLSAWRAMRRAGERRATAARCWRWRSVCWKRRRRRAPRSRPACAGARANAWKDLVFTEEQPFLPGEAGEAWLKRKALYRQMKAEGKI